LEVINRHTNYFLNNIESFFNIESFLGQKIRLYFALLTFELNKVASKELFCIPKSIKTNLHSLLVNSLLSTLENYGTIYSGAF